MFSYVVRTVHDDEEVCVYAYPKTVTTKENVFTKYYDIVKDKEFYKKEILGIKDNLSALVDNFSYYSLTFYEHKEDDNAPLRFIQTNRSNNPNLYKYFLYENLEKRKNKNQLNVCTCPSTNFSNIQEGEGETVENESNQDNQDNQDGKYEMSSSMRESSMWKPSIFRNVSVPPRSRLYLFQYPNYKGRMILLENRNNSNYIYSINTFNDDDISSYKWYTMFPNKNKYVQKDDTILIRPEQLSVEHQLNESRIQDNPDLNLPIYTLLTDVNSDVTINKFHDT